MGSESVGWFCCPSGDVSADLTLGKTGYVPGEKILFRANIDNQCDKEMKDARARIIQVSAYSVAKQISDT